MSDAEVLTTALVAARYFGGNLVLGRYYTQQHWGMKLLNKSGFTRHQHRLSDTLPVSLGADTTVCEGSEVLLGPLGASALPPRLTYRWSTGATTPTILVQQVGTYTLQLHSICGTRTASMRVTYRPYLTISNVITPNGDTHNDQFKNLGMQGSWNLRLDIRWGRRICYSSAYANDWGRTQSPGYNITCFINQATPWFKRLG